MNRNGLSGQSVLVGVCILLLIMSLSAAAQTTRYAWWNSPSPTPPYTSWNTAADNIQDAVNASVDGDTILVNDDAAFQVTSPINVSVGVTIRGVENSRPGMISGGHSVACFYLNNPNAILDNLLIFGGRANTGGGVTIGPLGGTVQNCKINNNYALLNGGGVYLNGNGTVRNCRIENNSCGDAGGGVFFNNGGSVYGSTIQGNHTDNSSSMGGGAYIDTAGQVESCLVTYNFTSDRGGGVYMNGGLVKDCSVQENTATYWGGGIDCDHGGTVLSCTIADNTAASAGGIHIWPGVYVYDSIIYDNTASSSYPNWFRDGGAGIGGSFEYCCLSPLFSAAGNFDADPRFANPAAENYRLMWNSPCINAASPGTPDPSDKDADLKARMLRGHQDMGAYEFGCINNDFDADGKTDIGIFRPSTVTWYVFQSTAGPMAPFQFGTFGDLPVPGDYDSDGHSDLAIFRPSTVTWYVFGSRVGPLAPFQFGTTGDLPAPADYDGDGQSDLAIYRPSTMTWYVFGSSAGPIAPFVFGAPGDIPVPADYDGDGKADLAVFRPSTVTWYRYGSTVGPMPAFQFGTFGDLPMPGDYDGDGQVDMAIFRPSTVTWYIFGTSAGPMPPFQFGTFGDRPLRPFQ